MISNLNKCHSNHYNDENDYSINNIPDNVLKKIFNYVASNKFLTRFNDISAVSRVCKNWRTITTPIIEKIGKKKFKAIIEKVQNSGQIFPCELNIMARFIDEETATERLVSRLINGHYNHEVCSRALEVSTKIKKIHFLESLTHGDKIPPQIVLKLFERLIDQQNECVSDLVERGNLFALKTIMSSENFKVSAENIFKIALENKKQNIVDYICKKNPELLKEIPPPPPISWRDVRNASIISFHEFERLLNEYIKRNGNKITVNHLEDMCINTEWIREKEKSFDLIVEAYIQTNQIKNVSDLYHDFDCEVFIRIDRHMNSPQQQIARALIESAAKQKFIKIKAAARNVHAHGSC